MSSKITLEEFDFLTRRAGLVFSAQQRVEIYRAYEALAAMAERVRTPRPIDAEPAAIFAFDEETAP